MLAAALPAAAADWPQLQGNPQRTGYTADSPQPVETTRPRGGPKFSSYTLRWTHYFGDDEQKVHPQAQPIVYDDRVFVGTKQGCLYCFDAADGAVLWKWSGAQGPILNTAAAADGRVLFSCLDGKVRALDAKTGELLWTFDGGIHGFCSAPCLAEGKAFLGSRAGVFYCLDQATGNVVWERKMNRYIFCSAAWNDGRVFFGTEDMIFHCLDAENGGELWTSEKLYGFTFKESFPMVHGGRVVARTFSRTHAFGVPAGRALIEDASARGEFAAVPPETSDLLLAHLRENPHEQSMYVFDEKTGAVPFMVCHNMGGTNGGPAATPCVDADGNWHIAVTCDPNAEKWWTGMIFVSINPDNGRFGRFLWTAGSKNGNGANPDEQENFSVGGNILFVSQQEQGEAGHWCAFDLAAPKEIAIPRAMGFNEGVNYNQQEAGGHAFAISGRRFYHIAFHCLGCWEGGEPSQ